MSIVYSGEIAIFSSVLHFVPGGFYGGRGHFFQTIAKKHGFEGLDCSAGFQPAVSPIFNRRDAANAGAHETTVVSQAGSAAIQQVGNLRYSKIQPQPGKKHALVRQFGVSAQWIEAIVTASDVEDASG